MKKECKCSHLQLIRDSNGYVIRVECINCKKIWNWNPLLKYWSDSFVGTFVKSQEEVLK